MTYKFLEHTADVKFQASGKTIKEAFENSAKALFETIYGDIKVKRNMKKEFDVEASDDKALLYSFLEEFLFLLDSEGLIFSSVRIKTISSGRLSVACSGDFADNYKFTNDVKAITYNDMKIENLKGRWVIEGVFDV